MLFVIGNKLVIIHFFESLSIEFTHGYNKSTDIGITYLQLLDTNLLIYDTCKILSKDGFY